MAGNQFKTDELGGRSFSATYTTEQYPLGTTALQLSDDVNAESGVAITVTDATWNKLGGDREWVFVYAKTEITAGYLCEWDFDHGIAYAVDPATTADQIVNTIAGVADNDIAAGSYGWIIKRGVCVVKAASDVATAGEPLASSGNDGEVDDDGAAGTCVGVAIDTVGLVAASHVQAYISVP